MAPDRKSSPLAEDDTAPWDDPAPAPARAPAPAAAEPSRTHSDQRKQPPEQAGSVVPIRTGRRKRSSREVDDFDLVSFNCNLPVITRRKVRAFAAEQDVDLQDVVHDALVRYLAEFGVQVPRTPDDQH